MKLYTNTNRILSTLMASTMTLSLLATTTTATPTTQPTQSTTISTPYAVTKENSYAYLMRLLELLGNESQTPEEVAAALTEVQQALRECTYNGEVLTRANADVLQSMVYNAPTISEIDKEELNALIESLVAPMGTTSYASENVVQLSNTSVTPLGVRTLSAAQADALSPVSIMTLSEGVSEAPTFTDVPTSHWGYQYVTDAASEELGLVRGYEDGSFKPDQAMTVGEFLVMLTNTYPELKELSLKSAADSYVRNDNGYEWYSPYVYAAHKSGLFPVGMNPTVEDMTNGIKREEAAYIVYKAMTTVGGEMKIIPVQPFDTSVIKDYSSIADGKREAVVEMYLAGIMSGYDNGNFGAQDELTRAQLCVIMLALNENERRNPYVAPSAGTSNADYPDAVFGPNGEQIITQGEQIKRPQAVEGDIVIDANGNRVELVVGDSGVLGEGQGVAADLGLIWPSFGMVTVGGSGNLDGALNSLGDKIGNAIYWQNQITGEAHWSNEWSEMSYAPSTSGEFTGQLSDDYNWYWSTDTWISVVSRTFSAEQLALLKADNGLT